MAKILVADDEELIRRLIGDCLKKEGHTPLFAADGEEAFSVFEKNGDIELVLLEKQTLHYHLFYFTFHLKADIFLLYFLQGVRFLAAHLCFFLLVVEKCFLNFHYLA